MSWGEVKKIAEKIDLMSMHRDIFVGNATYTVPISGRYRIIAIGRGGNGVSSTEFRECYGGGSGGIGVLEVSLIKGDSYPITVGTNASFGSLITATGASGRNGGTVSGEGVIKYPGKQSADRNGASVSWTGGHLSNGGSGYSSGGSGAFGGNGGSGGVAFKISSYQVNMPGTSGEFGGGQGAPGKNSYNGGGGGGGFGGGGGSTPPTSGVSATSGTGGAAAVIIQYLGF